MGYEKSLAPQWPASYGVGSSPGWTPGAYEGDYLVDATGIRRLIVANGAATLLLWGQQAANPGVTFAVGSSPGWTAQQYANTPEVSSYFFDSAGTRWLILQNTTSMLVLAGSGTPATGAGWKIVQGGVVATSAQYPGSRTAGTGYWQITTPGGTLVTSSATYTGAVTSTAGSGTITTVPGAAAVPSGALDGRGLKTLSVDLGFLTGSSPKAKVDVQISNLPDVASTPAWQQDAPAPTDPSWVTIPVSLDFADPATGNVINDEDQHTLSISSSAWVGFRWFRLLFTPDPSEPGTGTLTSFIYAWGP